MPIPEPAKRLQSLHLYIISHFLELFIQNSFFTISIFAASQIQYGKGKK